MTWIFQATSASFYAIGERLVDFYNQLPEFMDSIWIWIQNNPNPSIAVFLLVVSVGIAVAVMS